jgi:plasmid maintenance system antidote protein VapI
MKKKSKSKPTDLEVTLRKAVLDSGLTRYSVAKQAGIDVAALLRFVSGQRTLTLPKAGKLADFLELELQPKNKE